jgi:hypothetical protein
MPADISECRNETANVRIGHYRLRSRQRLGGAIGEGNIGGGSGLAENRCYRFRDRNLVTVSGDTEEGEGTIIQPRVRRRRRPREDDDV